MGSSHSIEDEKRLIPSETWGLEGGFWNVRASFKVKSILEIGTHMSIIRLQNGKFLVIDTVPLDPRLKEEFDQLTNNGKDIEAVIATHPFHTLAFPAFREAYPDAPFYGCPRHLRTQPELKWEGEISQHLCRWKEDVEMRIPAGCEYVAPVPEASNHFVSVWVLAKKQKCVHVDDTLNYFADPNLLMKVAGVHKEELMFHPSMKGPGLYPTPEAPEQFKQWVLKVIQEWEFEAVCTAHRDILPRGGRQKLAKALNAAEPLFADLKKRNEKGGVAQKEDGGSAQYNVEGCECG
uniref:Metallo-beta-lactamase domain-containing protein n=1 Tax=Paramoeba aestuarina TaxID=180227 RepID=A0A7S4P470_9EUKA|mmetsp:Transcript_35774/g.55893  ORF Transcript_35774/g.55893 Transcript_35774/m.55893 type:complete len:292 (+) Transcript_35774:93-968(+)|eukprot:CAMPEP_0201510878 /NCGR_PEP_ID=MMETSP0161_2-20130828/3419_1 /ASSEMBLY_ACC=CAM_ASM_000251 /TAXON_ID=180227 /ORGANISM="Neoparamoeba aestuarina, Strain SoJaBio B1-5/56/2" /LENGTH=291 /DNA_ID=CAMNT_0047906141 /DNA_START=108 /DNA_END=983 /DNA_ORIENTATION=+